MIGQSFFFNAVFFTYGLVVKKFFHVSDQRLPLHLLPFALASFFGPIILGRFFDSVGRRPMITATYGISGLMLAATLYPFASGMLSAKTLDICFSVIFFVASSAASAAYLTVSEIFPLEIRAFAIAIFYAIGTLLGGVGAPILFGVLIASGSRIRVDIGYAIGALLMLIAAVCEWTIGVEAAGKSLESISNRCRARVEFSLSSGGYVRSLAEEIRPGRRVAHPTLPMVGATAAMGQVTMATQHDFDAHFASALHFSSKSSISNQSSTPLP